MKVILKSTGEEIEVRCSVNPYRPDEVCYEDVDKNIQYAPREVEIFSSESNINWEQRRYEIVKEIIPLFLKKKPIIDAANEAIAAANVIISRLQVRLNEV